MLTIKEVNQAIMLQTWTDVELRSMIDAVKWNREQLAKRIKRSIGRGEIVHQEGAVSIIPNAPWPVATTPSEVVTSDRPTNVSLIGIEKIQTHPFGPTRLAAIDRVADNQAAEVSPYRGIFINRHAAGRVPYRVGIRVNSNGFRTNDGWSSAALLVTTDLKTGLVAQVKIRGAFRQHAKVGAG